MLHRGLAVELENAGIKVPRNQTNAVREFLRVKDDGIFKKIEEERLKKEEKEKEKAVRWEIEINKET